MTIMSYISVAVIFVLFVTVIYFDNFHTDDDDDDVY